MDRYVAYFYEHLGSVWTAVSPLLYVWAGSALTRRSQANQWVKDRKLREYSELLDLLLERQTNLLYTKSTGEQVMPGKQEAERDRNAVDLWKAFQNRLFIDDSIRKLGVMEKWREIERSISQTTSAADSGARMDKVIEELRESAKDSVR